MHSAIVRPAVRSLPRSVRASGISRTNASRRTFASEAPGDAGKTETTRPMPPNPSGTNTRLPLAIAALVLLAIVPGRYILASNKEARSGHTERAELRKGADPSQEFRDPRDGGVKTLEQKRQKEQNS